MTKYPFEPYSGTSDPELNATIFACLRELIATLKPDEAELIERIDFGLESGEVVADSMGVSTVHLDERLIATRKLLKKRLLEMCLICPEHGISDCHCDTAKRLKLLRAATTKS